MLDGKGGADSTAQSVTLSFPSTRGRLEERLAHVKDPLEDFRWAPSDLINGCKARYTHGATPMPRTSASRGRMGTLIGFRWTARIGIRELHAARMYTHFCARPYRPTHKILTKSIGPSPEPS